MTLAEPLLVIGGGNMGRAIVQGAIAAGVLDPARVVVLDPDESKHDPFVKLGCLGCAHPGGAMSATTDLEAQHGSAGVLLAVKPQMLRAVAESAGEALRSKPRLVMSILAGVTTGTLADSLGGRIIRLMPNTPAQVGKGLTALCPGPEATGADLAAARDLFNAVGGVVELPERLIDAFTAVAGSGPAYLFYLTEAMAAGAEAVGFDRDQAVALARGTVTGAAALLDASTETHPADLRAMVTSKGGTTAAATGVLDASGLVGIMTEAMIAARDRGRELGAG